MVILPGEGSNEPDTLVCGLAFPYKCSHVNRLRMRRSLFCLLLAASCHSDAVVVQHDVHDSKDRIPDTGFPAVVDLPHEGHVTHEMDGKIVGCPRSLESTMTAYSFTRGRFPACGLQAPPMSNDRPQR